MKTLPMLLLTASVLTAGVPASAQVKWETDLKVALERAQKENKPVLVDAYTDWCKWCIVLKEKTFPAPEAVTALSAVVPLSLRLQDNNFKSTDTYGAMAKYRIDAFPTLLMLDAKGNLLARTEGYLEPKPFAAWVTASARLAPAR